MSDTQPAGTPAAEPSTVFGHEGEDPAIVAATHRLVEQAKRGQWAAALRWESDQLRTGKMPQDYAASCVYLDAHRIERGALTPWADTPEPPTPPAQPPADSRAAADGHPGTLDGPGVLGRALLDRDGDTWPMEDRAYAERRCGPVREVLLVDPAAGRVLDAARAWLDTYERSTDRVHLSDLQHADRQLADAVDAYDRPTTGGPDPTEPPISYQVSSQPAGEYDDDCLQTGAEVRARGETGCCRWCGYPAAAHPGDTHGAPDCDQPPEPAGDGPGWDRCEIQFTVDMIDSASRDINDGRFTVNMVQAIRALLADRDRQHDRRFALNQMLSEAWDDRDAARAELAGVTASRAEAARSARDSAAYAEQGWAEVERLRAALATARRDAAADALDDGAGRVRRIFTETTGPRVAQYLDAIARGYRHGARRVPGSPEPAPAGGEEAS